MSFEVKNMTKTNPPTSGLVFKRMKEKILGNTYNLSVVFIGEKKMRTLNRTYRIKDKSTDILSFPIEKNAGEIFLCLKTAYKVAPEFGRKKDNFIYFLFIHGLLHLKGMDHGSRMESEEEKYRKLFKI